MIEVKDVILIKHKDSNVESKTQEVHIFIKHIQNQTSEINPLSITITILTIIIAYKINACHKIHEWLLKLDMLCNDARQPSMHVIISSSVFKFEIQFWKSSPWHKKLTLGRWAPFRNSDIARLFFVNLFIKKPSFSGAVFKDSLIRKQTSYSQDLE